MSDVGQRERPVQDRVVLLFADRLGYRYLGNRQYRPGNSNIEQEDLRAWLRKQDTSETLITRALHRLTQAAALGEGKTLYEANCEVYQLLRYGVKVREAAGEQNQTVRLIDWEKPENNDFAVAEEVTVFGNLTRRPDVVLYVNGIALGVLELKRSTISVGESIRQNLGNQKKGVFGPYILTYKYDEAVRDGAVLDLRYVARDIDQEVTSRDRIDRWFEVKTSGLTDDARAQLKQRWGTMQKILSSRDRLGKIVDDILFDMETRDRLMSRRGNAMLVSGSIYQACKLYEMFSETDLAGKCAIVTSYRPAPGDIRTEETGAGLTEKLHQYEVYRRMLADFFDVSEDVAMNKAVEFEQKVKQKFVNEPGQMRLLIVVDKLLTGFDAPPATYLYIDKKVQNHGLFQAICRVNRLDGEDKEYGYIEGAVADFTGEALEGYGEEDVAGLLKNRLQMGRGRLEETRETVRALCEPVSQPRNTIDYIRYFCAEDTADKDAVKDNERKRIALYRAVSSFVRAYANIANEMLEAGYTPEEAESFRREADHYEKVRQEIKMASGDYVDMKSYELAMRHLLDTYIRAEESKTISAFDDKGLIELLVERGRPALNELPAGIREDEAAMSETMENNIRKVIIDEQPVNPKYYDKMSELLDALIQQRKDEALDYESYLDQLVKLAGRVHEPLEADGYPTSMDTPARRALYDNLDGDENVAVRIDVAVRHTRKDDWRGNTFKEREVFRAVHEELGKYETRAEEIFEIVKSQREY